MSTCTDLINAINAVVVDPNLLASVDPSTIAALDHTIGTTETAFQLSGGGAAVLSLASSSSVDGRRFKVVVSGKAHQDEGSVLGMYVGTSTTLASDSKLSNGFNISIPAAGRDGNFFLDATFIWDSVSQILNGIGTVITEQGSFNTGLSLNQVSVSSQSNLQFILSNKFSVNDSYNTITITQFDAKLA